MSRNCLLSKAAASTSTLRKPKPTYRSPAVSCRSPQNIRKQSFFYLQRCLLPTPSQSPLVLLPTVTQTIPVRDFRGLKVGICDLQVTWSLSLHKQTTLHDNNNGKLRFSAANRAPETRLRGAFSLAQSSLDHFIRQTMKLRNFWLHVPLRKTCQCSRNT